MGEKTESEECREERRCEDEKKRQRTRMRKEGDEYGESKRTRDGLRKESHASVGTVEIEGRLEAEHQEVKDADIPMQMMTLGSRHDACA